MHSETTANQRVFALVAGKLATLDLPPSDVPVTDWPFCWGDAKVPLTPAYWAAQCWMWELDAPEHFRLGGSLEEELLACMLGGHGIPAEVGLAAYRLIRSEMHACPGVLSDGERLLSLLSRPLSLDGRPVRYRFARQKAAYVSTAFRELPRVDPGLADRPLRDRLTQLRGVGPKTASWVVRNLRRSDEVAILDIHLVRAGRLLGIFEPSHTVERHYWILEADYLRFAQAIGMPASILDSVMWNTMRDLSSDLRKACGPVRRTPGPRRPACAA